jgi:hypothetical protein
MVRSAWLLFVCFLPLILFPAVNVQVNTQGEQLNQVETNTTSAAVNVESGTKELGTVRLCFFFSFLDCLAHRSSTTGRKTRKRNPKEEGHHRPSLYLHLHRASICACFFSFTHIFLFAPGPRTRNCRTS